MSRSQKIHLLYDLCGAIKACAKRNMLKQLYEPQWYKSCLPVLLSLLCASSVGGAVNVLSSYEEILIDSIQINPGDAYGNQPSKYADMRHLKSLGYTARSSSMEQTPALCVDFRTADRVPETGVFADNRHSMAWTKAYCQGMDRLIEETVSEGLDVYFFTDMIVFPDALLKAYPEVVQVNTTSTILYNKYAEYLLEIMFDEWFDRFPLTNGIVVRTGETYMFDTPYHSGSSPISNVANATNQISIWIDFINLLRNVVCIKHGRKVVFRTWGSLVDVSYYLDVTTLVDPHPYLYFAVKHTYGDFFRQMAFNDILGVGNHAQIIEVQVQREYEGKGSYPLYIFEHIVFGDESMSSNASLSKLFPTGRSESSIIKGLWTWSRGGGWWGPYIHEAEFWIDLNLNLFVSWWASNCTTARSDIVELFHGVCRKLIQPISLVTVHDGLALTSSVQMRREVVQATLPREACSNLREAALLSDRAMLYGRYCLESGTVKAYSGCWIWTRDDRIGGFGALGSHLRFLLGNETLIARSLWLKAESLVLWEQAYTIYESQVEPFVSALRPRVNRQIRSSFLYAKSYFCVVESAWRAMIHGVLGDNSTQTRRLIQVAVEDYDECWIVFRALALSTLEFPSLYKGNAWNFPFQSETSGMDASIDKLRRMVR
jgi:hypothetical protein